jgi:hypothetical protein
MALIVVAGPPIVLVGGTFPFALELKIRMESGSSGSAVEM